MTAIAIAIMVAMAIMYIVSAGNEDMMATAKKGIIGSLIGIVVILLAWVVVNFIFTLPIFANNGLVRTDGSWDTFTCNTTSQSGWSGTRRISGIGDGRGDVGSDQPPREGLPGPGGGPSNPPLPPGPPSPPSPPPSDDDGTGSTRSTPKCGATHFSCDVGTPSDMIDGGDQWTWLCKVSSYQQFCIEKSMGCGNGIVSGVNANGDLETCDEGARNILCEWGTNGIIPEGCDINFCVPCGSDGTPPTSPGCGPSHGTLEAPQEPLCVGGAVASQVQESNIGSGKRYDWECTVSGGSGSFQCFSGHLVDAWGNETAACGPAAGVPTADAPVINLCDPGVLDIYGVQAMYDATTGEPIWSWGCVRHQDGDGVQAQTSCTAPRIL